VEILNTYRGRVRWCALPFADEVNAINHGFVRTQGDLFGFLASGDLYRPDALWRAVAHYDAEPTVANAEPNVAVVFGAWEELDSEHGIRAGINALPGNGSAFDEERIERPIHRSAAFITREAFARAEMLNTKDRAASVDRLWKRIAEGGGLFRYSPRNFAITRQRTEVS
jgi:hypothetical protein